MGTRLDYARQAETYDATRAASPSILRPVLAALGGARGRRLLDVGGGTGNYSVAFREGGVAPIVADISHEMLGRARAKGLPVLCADAARLPVAPRSADAVTMISMLHLVPDWRAALREPRRVLRPGGRLVLQVFAREHLEVLWTCEYFPRFAARVRAEHQTLTDLLAQLPGAHAGPFLYEDLTDGTMAALCRHPPLLLDPARRSQTSFFGRLERDDPAELREGISKLERDLARGRRPDLEVAQLRARIGDGSVIAWTAS